MYEDQYSSGPGWEQQQVMEERMRRELDLLVVVHKWGLEGTARELAGSLGLSREFHQEIDAHARTASVG